MTATLMNASWHERRLARYVEARGEPGFVEALLGLKGLVFGSRHRIESLYNVGGESAVYETRDIRNPEDPLRIAKVALFPVHRPLKLESATMRKQRRDLRIESDYLASCGSVTLPRHDGLFEFNNPLLDAMRGGAFSEPDPLILMERLPGQDLDRWLARVHRSNVPQARVRRALERVSVMLLQALVDLYDRGFIYADLRPANLRVMGRPERFVRLLDAGSLVRVDDDSGRFPHVPSYLPPEVFRARLSGKKILATAQTQTVMTGRTLFEVATGNIPHAGKEIDTRLLKDSNVTPLIAEIIEGLCRGDFEHVRHAYRYLAKRATRRVRGGTDPTRATQQVEEQKAAKRKAARKQAQQKPGRKKSRQQKAKQRKSAAPPPAQPSTDATLWKRWTTSLKGIFRR
jgi:hypothetical protein